MTVFVAVDHIGNCVNRCRSVCLDLQRKNPSDTYIPVAVCFDHIHNGLFSPQDVFEIESDLLMLCDKMLVASEISPLMQNQMDYCRKVGIEVVSLEDEYRKIQSIKI